MPLCRDCKYFLSDGSKPPCRKCHNMAGIIDHRYFEPAEEPKKEIKMKANDNVNHPNHYCRKDGMECIEEMLTIFGIDETMSFCKLNAWKYRYRASDKNGLEDLQKSDWYIKKYTELQTIKETGLPFK